MNEIKEAYVSFEVAKLLQEKGFNEPCRSYFIDNADYIDPSYSTEELTDLNMGVWETLRPTHQMAMAWLREIKNIVIVPEIHTTIDPKDYYWGACIYYLDKPWDLVEYVSEPSGGKYEGYNNVIERAIKYSLENLI